MINKHLYTLSILFIINSLFCFAYASEKGSVNEVASKAKDSPIVDKTSSVFDPKKETTNSEQASLKQTLEVNLRIVPLTEVDSSRLEGILKIANSVNKYFSQPYKDATNKADPYYALKCPGNKVIFRPKHSLVHGMRQALYPPILLSFYRKLMKTSSVQKWVRSL